MVILSSHAYANPQEATVQAGQVKISQDGNKLDVYQETDKAIIDWRSFDIDVDEHTEFHQPSSNSFTLNRVNSNDPSRIDGQLSANGNIAIINPNGVYFGGGAQVDVGGLIATTSDIDNDDFMNDDINFTVPGEAGSRIVNDGSITVREAGLVGLVAPNVENNGTIEARLGKVQLVSGDTFTLDMAGDGLINVAVSEDQVRKIVNEGQIRVDGGAIRLSIADARENVDNLIVNKGSLSANSVGIKNGKIVLGAAGSNKSTKTGVSTVLNEGTIEAKGDQTGETGGTIHMLGDHVGAMAGSTLDVSGDEGGGEVLLGGEYQGAGDTQTAKITYVDETATINASATEAGDGGRVIAWADEVTRHYGDIKAEGGRQNGDGGFVEVSGKEHLDFKGTVSTEAVNGEAGTLLLDPTDIVISNAVDSNVNGASPFTSTIDDGPSNLNVTTLETALASNNITVQTLATGTQNGDITVSDAVSWTANRTLTLNAHGKIVIDAPMAVRNRLTLVASDLELNAAITENSSANIYIQPRSNMTMGIAGGAGAFNVSSAELDLIHTNINNVYFGRSSNTQAMDVGARTWEWGTIFYSRTGEMQFNGAQDFSNNPATIQTRSLAINNTLSGTSTLTIQPDTNLTVGVAGGAGALNISTAELNNIQNGFSEIRIGRTNSNQAVTVNAHTWNDSVQFRAGTGQIIIDGDQNINGNNFTLLGRNPVMNATVNGTGRAILAPDGNISIGAKGGAGTYQVTDALLSNFNVGTVRLGTTSNTQAMNVNAGTWNTSLELYTGSGVINVNGNQDVGTNNFGLFSNANPVINGDLIGTGTISLGPVATNVTTGLAGGAGTFNLSTAELDRIIDGWDQIIIGTTGNDRSITANAYTWRDDVRFQNDAAAIVINGDQNFGANNFTLRSDSNPAINAALTGTGILTFETEATNTTIGLAGASGTLNLSAAELGRITDGWSQIVVGTDTGTGGLALNAYTWNDSLRLLGSTRTITVAGIQNMGANNLQLTGGNLVLNAALNGTGILTFDQGTNNRSLGLAGGSGSYNISAAELNRITDGWSEIILGRADNTSTVNVNAYTWNDNVTFRNGSGQMRFVQAQDFGTNDATVESDNLRIDNNFTGTGDLTIAPSDITTSIGLAGGAGSLNLTTAELGRLSDGWSSITIGRADGTGQVELDAYANWSDPITLLKDASDVTNVINVAGAQSILGASNASLIFNGNTDLGANITTNNTDLTFGGPVTLLGNRAFATGTGDITFNSTIDGTFDLDIASTGDVGFNGDVGGVTRLGDVTITNPASVTSTGTFNSANMTIVGAAGSVDFSGGGANATGLIDIDAQAINGVYQAADGLLNANAGAINATVSFDTLDIDGASATLTAGYIGVPGSATQDMANLIKIQGVSFPAPNSLYSFAGYTIGFIPPETAVSPEAQTQITNTLLQTLSFDGSNAQASLVHDVENDLQNNGIQGLPYFLDYKKVVGYYLYVHPDLENILN